MSSAAKRAASSTQEPQQVNLQGQPIQFPPVEPWPEPVDGAVLLDDLRKTFERYLILPPGAAIAMALWTVHTHCHELFEHTPRLAFISAQMRSGKTSGLRALSNLVQRPCSTDNVTAAAVFRISDISQPTFLVDELETFAELRTELTGIINGGHRRGSKVIRLVGKDYEPRAFNIFSPLAIAKIGASTNTIMDRSIVVRMTRKLKSERIEKYNSRNTDCLDGLRRKCVRFVRDSTESLAKHDPQIPSELNDRAEDNWRPLLTIADIAGGEWPKLAREASKALAVDAIDESSVTTLLLSDIWAYFLSSETGAVPSSVLCDHLRGLDSRPWSNCENGNPITTAQIARLLSPFGIRPTQLWTGDPERKNLRGYHKAQLDPVVARYTDAQDR